MVLDCPFSALKCVSDLGRSKAELETLSKYFSPSFVSIFVFIYHLSIPSYATHTYKWVHLFFQSLSHAQLFASPWTATHQVSLSMEFSRQEYWSGQPFPSSEDLPDPGIEPRSPLHRWNLYHLSHQGSYAHVYIHNAKRIIYSRRVYIRIHSWVNFQKACY